MSDPVKIEHRLIDRIGIREWGLPTLRMPGQIWRSQNFSTISCMVPHPEDPNKVRIETCDLIVIPVGNLSIMPDHWRDAMLQYVEAYPASGAGLGPFLRITEAKRIELVRKVAAGLKDNIGCLLTAHNVGLLASVEYETIKPGEITCGHCGRQKPIGIPCICDPGNSPTDRMDPGEQWKSTNDRSGI